jgi:uncharacterized membrane protein YhaH (DUF805 family)
MFKNPLSFTGRIRRLEYGLSRIIGVFGLLSIMISFGSVLAGLKSDFSNSKIEFLFFLIFIPYFWFIWAQGAKRCHDLGKSGWWQILPFYSIWLLFLDGQPGSNTYGSNPKEIGMSTFNRNTNIQQTIDNKEDYQRGYNGGHNNQTRSHRTINNSTDSDGYKSGDLYK